MADRPPSEFEALTRHEKPSLLKDLVQLLRQNKKWWLLPIVVVLLLFGVLAIFAGTAAAPFIYTLF